MKNDDLLAELFRKIRTTDPPDVVYHYTAPQGLMGMLGDGVIRATDVQYLNDAQEFEYTLELARKAITGLYDKFPPDERQVFDECLRALDVAPTIRIYAASFSRNGNLLSQWRAYCPPTGGFSIGITSKVLERVTNTKLLPCVYDRNRQEALLGEIVGHLLNDWRARPKEEDETAGIVRRARYGATFLTCVLLLAAVYKDPSFKEEEEWRLTTRSSTRDPSALLFREGRSGLVPYVNFPIRRDDGSIRIDQIIVGPNPHPGLARRAVVSFLEAKKVEHDGVDDSGIPYRTW